MSNTVAIVELVASASSELDDRPSKNCFGCSDERTIYTRIWQGIAISSLAINITAMIIETSTIVIIAGIVACCIAPIVIVLQFKLQDTDTLRMVQNALRKEVNRLNEENDKLEGEVNELEKQVIRIQEEEIKLEALTKQYSMSGQELIQLLAENRITIEELKGAVKDDLIQTVVTACIDSDFDQSGNYSDNEIQILVVRMQSIPGIIVNVELFQHAIQASDRQIDSILALVKQLYQTDIPEEQQIFKFDESKLIKNSTTTITSTTTTTTTNTVAPK